jgi:hypothetical protein
MCKRLIVFLFVFILSIEIILGYPVLSENIYTNPDGTAKPGTFNVNNTIINETNDVIYSTNTSITTNVNGKFKKILDIPYFGNSTLRMRVILDSEDSGYQEIGYSVYSINTQYFQGKSLDYFPSLLYVNAVIASIGNWSNDKSSYYTVTEVNNGFYSKGATDLLLLDKLDKVDQRYNDTPLIVSSNNSLKSYVDSQDSTKLNTTGDGTINGKLTVNGDFDVIGVGRHVNLTVIDMNVSGNIYAIGSGTAVDWCLITGKCLSNALTTSDLSPYATIIYADFINQSWKDNVTLLQANVESRGNWTADKPNYYNSSISNVTYLKTDGTNNMNANLNMSNHDIKNITGMYFSSGWHLWNFGLGSFNWTAPDGITALSYLQTDNIFNYPAITLRAEDGLRLYGQNGIEIYTDDNGVDNLGLRVMNPSDHTQYIGMEYISDGTSSIRTSNSDLHLIASTNKILTDSNITSTTHICDSVGCIGSASNNTFNQSLTDSLYIKNNTYNNYVALLNSATINNTDSSTNALNSIGNVNSFFQSNIQNINNGSMSSSDIVATSNNGDDSDYYIDLGINSQNYSNQAYNITSANDGYLYVQNGSLAISTASQNTVIKFSVNGTTTDKTQMTINTTGISLNTPLPTGSGGTGRQSMAANSLIITNTTATGSLKTIGTPTTTGLFVRTPGGITPVPQWSTLVLPNTATKYQVAYASDTNTMGFSSGLLHDPNIPSVNITGRGDPSLGLVDTDAGDDSWNTVAYKSALYFTDVTKNYTALAIDPNALLITIADKGYKISLGTINGTIIGVDKNEKLGFHGTKPIIQQDNDVDPDTVLKNLGLKKTGTAPYNMTLYGGNLTVGRLLATNVIVVNNFTGNQMYAEMWFHNDTVLNATVITFPNVWYNVSALRGVQNSNNHTTNGFNFVNGSLNCTYAGRYTVNYCISGTTGNSNRYHFTMGINTVPQLNTEQHSRASSGGDDREVCGTGIMQLAVGDQTTLMVENEAGSNNFDVNSVNVNLLRIGD